jgi:hypothetical protein
MKLLLHIFKKDARHLWPQIAVTLAILAALGREDRWRADWLAGQTEGWLNLLLPIAWVFLIGLAVGQEPIAGDRQFWITRPYRRSGLLAAKLLFAIAFVHLPFLVEQSYVLAARGFSPLNHVPQLLWNQVLLLAALTLPAIALAALAGTFTQFVMEVVGVAAAVIFVRSTFHTSPMPWQRVETVRIGVTLAVIAAGSLAIAWMQYFGRRVRLSRGVGIAAGVAAGVLFAVLLPRSAFAVHSALAPIHEPLALALDTAPRPSPGPSGNSTSVLIPVVISGMSDAQFHVEGLGMRLVAPGGVSYQSPARPNYESFQKIPFFGWAYGVSRDDATHAWLSLRFDPALYRDLKDADVEIEGELGITAYRLGDTTWMDALGSARTPLAGACTGLMVEDPWSQDLLKVKCESPDPIPTPTRVRMWDPQTGRDWNASLGDSAPYAGGPRWTWLTALDRRQTFFHLAGDPKGPGSQWVVPRSVVPAAKIAITPEIVTGYSVLKYRLTGIKLSRYWVAPYQR